jgi:hypothetical protein
LECGQAIWRAIGAKANCPTELQVQRKSQACPKEAKVNNLQKALTDLRLHYDVFQVNLGEDVYQVFERSTQVRVATIRPVMAAKVQWACGVESDIVRAALQNNGLWVV